MLDAVLRNLWVLETLRPYYEQARDPYRLFLGYSEESGEADLDYRSKRSSETITMDAKFFVRGQGKPKPYTLEDD